MPGMLKFLHNLNFSQGRLGQARKVLVPTRSPYISGLVRSSDRQGDLATQVSSLSSPLKLTPRMRSWLLAKGVQVQASGRAHLYKIAPYSETWDSLSEGESTS